MEIFLMSSDLTYENQIKDLIEERNSRKIKDEIILNAMKNILKNDYSNTKLEVRDLDNGKKEYLIVVSEN